MMMRTMDSARFNRGTGLLVVAARMSNINGDPDMNNDPRMDSRGIGLVSPVSVHRKLRDLVGEKGDHWNAFRDKMGLDSQYFDILETRGRDRAEIIKGLATNGGQEQALDRYWDARVFGCTFLDEATEAGGFIRTGVLHFGCGESIQPLEVERLTLTNKAGVEEGKDRGMAPNAYRVARNALYAIPFFVDPTRANATRCSANDIQLALNLIPYIYESSKSLLRSQVYIRKAWYVEHRSPIGSCPDHLILGALMPTLDEETGDTECYSIPDSLEEELLTRVKSVENLMERI